MYNDFSKSKELITVEQDVKYQLWRQVIEFHPIFIHKELELKLESYSSQVFHMHLLFMVSMTLFMRFPLPGEVSKVLPIT